MKAQIQYRKTDSSEGIALTASAVTSTVQAKQDLAAKLNLPIVESGNEEADIDARLRKGNIDPESISFSQLSE